MSVTTKKKHVERELNEDFSLPTDNQSIVRVVKPRGNNLHQVITADGEEFLVSMPQKFRKHVWIKRGDYVVIDPIPEGNKVRAEIARILLKDHIRYIVQNKQWPLAFSEEYSSEKESEARDKLEKLKVADDGESDTDSDSDSLLMENPNRPKLYVEESESSESESEDDSESNEDEDSGDSKEN